ncbi:hypothetical protein KLEP7_gp122 [Pseudaeromonas phage vB_PpeM_ KLEP7]|nr:hypothetical protein KLEP7_gp122 [Pseudaeromonas phage vB_PpeM_ KLEP7]
MKNSEDFIKNYVNNVFANHLSFDYPDEYPKVLVTYTELVSAVNTIILDAIPDVELQSAAFNVQLQKD